MKNCDVSRKEIGEPKKHLLKFDLISSDREAAAFVMALDDLEKAKTPEMVPSVQQLCFA